MSSVGARLETGADLAPETDIPMDPRWIISLHGVALYWILVLSGLI